MKYKLVRDEDLKYEGYWKDGAKCRFRLYENDEGIKLIILSELIKNQNTSITNRCERVFCLAWNKCGKPTPDQVRFFEHYPGTGNTLLTCQTVTEVAFPIENGTFCTRPFYFAGERKGDEFRDPQWTDLDLDHVTNMVGEI